MMANNTLSDHLAIANAVAGITFFTTSNCSVSPITVLVENKQSCMYGKIGTGAFNVRYLYIMNVPDPLRCVISRQP